MADNVAITPGSGANIAADEISSVLHQRVKIEIGADGSATDVSSTNPMPSTLVDASGNALASSTSAPTGSERAIIVRTITAAFTSGQITNVSVGTTATVLPTSALTGRRLVRVTNPATPFGYPTTIAVGYANTIVALPSAGAGAGGWQLQPGQSREFAVTTGQSLYAITTTQALVVQVEEFA